MPRQLSKRIMQRCEKGKPFVVIPKNGKPSRLYGLPEYEKMRETPKRHKPWERRAGVSDIPDPLGAVDAKVISPLRREDIYE